MIANTEDMIKFFFGPDLLPLVEILLKKDNISEFDLAKKLKMNINHVRNMLYRLSHKNLVYFYRQKDKEKGWYIYYWTLNKRVLAELIIKQKESELKSMKDQIEGKEEQLFTCENECFVVDMDEAMELQYRCYECGEILKPIKPEKTIGFKKRIKELNQEVEQIREEEGKRVSQEIQEQERIVKIQEEKELKEKEKLQREKEKETAKRKREISIKLKKLVKKRKALELKKKKVKLKKEKKKKSRLAKKQKEKEKKKLILQKKKEIERVKRLVQKAKEKEKNKNEMKKKKEQEKKKEVQKKRSAKKRKPKEGKKKIIIKKIKTKLSKKTSKKKISAKKSIKKKDSKRKKK